LSGRLQTQVAVVGAGPAGLYAAELLAAAGLEVCVFDRMPSPARKFLLAGRSGLNLTHTEALERFITRYGAQADRFADLLAAFSPADLRAWAAGLGIDTFVGSSGRVFPVGFKASTLVRAWLRRLDGLGVRLLRRHCWRGFDDGALLFDDADGRPLRVDYDAALLALGGGSWPRTGSDGGWAGQLAALGVPLAPFQPANAGLLIDWPGDFADRFAGTPVKPAALSIGGRTVRGEFVITRTGVEGGAAYALCTDVRQAFNAGAAVISIDLRPDQSAAALAAKLSRPRGRLSVGPFVRKALNLSDVAYALLVMLTPRAVMDDPAGLAAAIKALPLPVAGVAGLDRAISTAGGVRFDGVDDYFMLKALPGVFLAGEMLDWEAPTGGYLLQGCFSTAVRAASGIERRLRRPPPFNPPVSPFSPA
jgi:uncharacterized flavoprotein (TIGR03862 family)